MERAFFAVVGIVPWLQILSIDLEMLKTIYKNADYFWIGILVQTWIGNNGDGRKAKPGLFVTLKLCCAL